MAILEKNCLANRNDFITVAFVVPRWMTNLIVASCNNNSSAYGSLSIAMYTFDKELFNNKHFCDAQNAFQLRNNLCSIYTQYFTS